MLRMEIALIIILGFIAYMYYSAERKHTKLHRTFSILLLVVIVHLVFDAVTIYTVNHLEQVPLVVNDAVHRVFVGTMAGVLYLFYRYIAAVVEEETKKKMIFDWPAKIFLIVLEIIALVFPIVYIQTPNGNYSAGAYVIASYGGVAIYLALCAGILIWNWKQIHVKKKFAIGVALLVEFLVCGLQGAYPTWLISGMGITLMTLSFYLTLENPDILRAELTEQKMSMLYLKSQVNPHFLYNTLEGIRAEALIAGVDSIAEMTEALATYFRYTISQVNNLVTLEEELANVENYYYIQQFRFGSKLDLRIRYDCEDEEEALMCQLPKLTLQPIVENSIYHGLEQKIGKGCLDIKITMTDKHLIIMISDDGVGMEKGQVRAMNEKLRALRLEEEEEEENGKRGGIAVKNVNNRIKLLFGEEYGIYIYSQLDVGTDVEITLPIVRD